jgi:hypothetical protein
MFVRDMWVLRPPAYQWTMMNPDSAWPNARAAHSAVIIPGAQGTEFWIFGGRDTSIIYADLWKYSFVQNQWTKIVPQGSMTPDGRVFHTAVSYQIGSNNYMLIFGGTDGADIHMNELWRYDFQANSWTFITPKGQLPSPRVGHQAIINTVGNNPYMWIFGGQGVNGELNDVWLYDINGGTWSLVSYAEVLPRAYFGAAALNKTSNIIYGGFMSDTNNITTSLLSDMWVQTLGP